MAMAVGLRVSRPRGALARAVPAGVADAAASSVGTLALGVYAARSLDVASLGAYGLFFSAFLVAAVVPTALVLQPAEIAAAAGPLVSRQSLWRHTVPQAVVPAAQAGLLATAAAWLVARDIGTGAASWLALTALAACVVSPLQDHLRRLLHLSGRSWAAAGTSLALLASVGVGLGLVAVTEVPAAAVPFGLLAVGKLGSGCLAVALIAHQRPPAARPPAGSELLASGRWLLLLGLVPTVTGFLVYGLVSRLASLSALGEAEAARVVAQPVLVGALGISAVIGPRMMALGARGALPEARRLLVVNAVLVLVGAVAYAGLVAVPWWGNPMGRLVPAAYLTSGLVLVALVPVVLQGMVLPLRAELLGGRLERPVAGTELVAAVAAVLTAATAGVTTVLAPLLSGAVYAGAQTAGYQRLRRRL